MTYVNNVAAENFYGLLKQEMYDGEAMVSYDELKQKIERYIYNFNHEGIK
ncbi:IS3 family transposase [Planomicrobium sp. MB-3u-38]|nr:IS3 family transposase [Planomicrobium sp. MB-3u-38]